MKTRLSILALLFTLAFASMAEPYFPGAWYSTKQFPMKQAGGLEVKLFNDGTLDFDIYLGGEFNETVVATWFKSGNFDYFVAVDSDGWVWSGKINLATKQLTGTFRNQARTLAGKFQCSFGDDGL